MARVSPADLINAFNSGRPFKNDKEDRARETEKWKYEEDDLKVKFDANEANRQSYNAIQGFFGNDRVDTPEPTSPVSGGISPVDATTGAPTAQESPMGAGTQVGARPPGAQQFQMPKIEDFQDRMFQAERLAAEHPDYAEQLTNYTKTMRGSLMREHQNSFDGDLATNEGLQDYSKHMAKGSAMLGKVQTPEEIKGQQDFVKQMKAEGYAEALAAIKSGDVAGANEIWNASGKLKGTITNVQDSFFDIAGVSMPGQSFDIIGKDGQVIDTMNTAEMDFQGQMHKERFDQRNKGATVTKDSALKDQQISASKTSQAEVGKKSKREDDKTTTDIKAVESGITIAESKEARAKVEQVAKNSTIEQTSKGIYLVNKIDGTAKDLGIGTGTSSAKGSTKDRFGRTNSDIGSQKDRATKLFRTGINVVDGEFGLKGLEKEDGPLYTAISD